MVCRLGALVVCLYLGAHSAIAGTLFQWKDDMGHMHFTDDKSRVPAKYLKSSARDMKSFEPELTKPVLKGQALYENLCAKCHVLGFEDKGRREALGWTIVDSTTKYPKAEVELFNRLRYVVDGGIDMPVIKMTDDELMTLIGYLIKKLSS